MRAAIDLGSNSVLLTIVDAADEVLHDEARVVGLGRGIQRGEPFAPDRVEAALAALVDYAAIAREHGIEAADIDAVATSAARRATDSRAFFDRVEERTGLGFRIIGGEEEARLTFLGALAGLGLQGSLLVVDLGGGSTELATGAGCPMWSHSYEIGSVRLTEAVLGGEIRVATDADLLEMSRVVERTLSFPPVTGEIGAVVGVAGQQPPWPGRYTGSRPGRQGVCTGRRSPITTSPTSSSGWSEPQRPNAGRASPWGRTARTFCWPGRPSCAGHCTRQGCSR